jgi:hypothetical protein
MKRKESLFFVTTITLHVVCLFLGLFFIVESDAAESMSDYIRVSRQDGKVHPVSLDTPIITFANKKKGIEVTLVGAVHIADKKYYDELNEEFKKYDAVLFELVVDEKSKNKDKLDKKIFDRKKNSSYKDIQSSIGDFLDLSHQVDHIDYRAVNMIHADLTMEEFLRRVSERGDLFTVIINEYMSAAAGMNDGNSNELELQGRLIGSLLASNPALSLKRNIARIFTSDMGDASKYLPKDGSAIISDRNEAALKILKKEIKKGTKKIAIFYGCAHLPEFAASLKNDLKLKKTETKWIVAWDLTKNKTARNQK